MWLGQGVVVNPSAQWAPRLTQATGGLSMRVIFTKCDGDDLKLLGLDQLPYVMLRYVAFILCYDMF